MLLHSWSSTAVPAVEHRRSVDHLIEAWLLSSASESFFEGYLHVGDRLMTNHNLVASSNRPSLYPRSSPCSSSSLLTVAHVWDSLAWHSCPSAGCRWDPDHESTLSHTWHNSLCWPCWFSSKSCNASPPVKKPSLWQSLEENLRLLNDDSSKQQTPSSMKQEKGS